MNRTIKLAAMLSACMLLAACVANGDGSKSQPSPAATADCEKRSSERLMLIEDVFALPGRDPVITGRVESGAITVGDRLVMEDSTARVVATVRAIEMFRKQVSTAPAGSNVGVAFSGSGLDKLSGGQAVYRCR